MSLLLQGGGSPGNFSFSAIGGVKNCLREGDCVLKGQPMGIPPPSPSPCPPMVGRQNGKQREVDYVTPLSPTHVLSFFCEQIDVKKILFVKNSRKNTSAQKIIHLPRMQDLILLLHSSSRKQAALGQLRGL